MSNRQQDGRAGNSYAVQNLNVFFPPAKALSAWNPLLTIMLKGNAEAQEGFGRIATEWLGFVGHRLQYHAHVSLIAAHPSRF